jgi:hypothetical protein
MSKEFLKVFCPKCGQNLEYSADFDEPEIHCPECGNSIPVEHEIIRPTGSLLSGKAVFYVCAIVALVLVAMWAPRLIDQEPEVPGPLRNEAPLRKWQYVLFDPNDVRIGSHFVELRIPTRTAACYALDDVMEKLGQEGFELAHFSTSLAILKRPDAGQQRPEIIVKRNVTSKP